MDLLEKKDYYNNLFDLYHNLLTTKQKDYFRKYYFEDFSLAEIAAFYKISRSAVYDQLQKVYLSLEQYEEKLSLFKNYQKRSQIYDEYIENDDERIISLINKLKELE